MMALQIASVTALDELLSRPTESDVEAMRRLDGDLLLLGAGGKMGPSLARRARRADEQAGVRRRIIAVSRFTSVRAAEELEQAGVETIAGDLLDPDVLASLPDAANVLFMAGQKFGSAGSPAYTWAMNTWLPGATAMRFKHSRIVAFSSGNVYPFLPLHSGGATEETPPHPVGEYAQSVLGRERIFEFHALERGIPTLILRLNYAVELRYGVLLDIGRKVFERQPIDLQMPMVNVIWQGDANSVALRSFALAQSPALVLNLTGPEMLSVRCLAHQFGSLFGVAPLFAGEEGDHALLNNASRCQAWFGYPQFGVSQLIEWTAAWIGRGGEVLDKPTHYETRDGKF